jgi:sugar lactone lactonase YvrE
MEYNTINILAEGPLWQSDEKCWYYVDIVAGVVFKRDELSVQKVMQNRPNVSNIVRTNRGLLITIEDEIVLINDKDLSLNILCCVNQSSELRINDGSVGPDGRYWFGTMEKQPSGLNGKVYSLDQQGKLEVHGDTIGIPNSFIWLNDKQILISDSFVQKTYLVELLASGILDWQNRKVWLDLSETAGTPDGGALDQDGNVWIAIWGGAAVHKYSPRGKFITKVPLFALQPTSCAFGGENMDELLITTATEGMSKQQLQVYPDSGKVVLQKMDIKGTVLHKFNLEV